MCPLHFARGASPPERGRGSFAVTGKAERCVNEGACNDNYPANLRLRRVGFQRALPLLLHRLERLLADGDRVLRVLEGFLVFFQLQLGFLKGQWSVMCDGFCNAGSLAKNTTTLVVQVRLVAAP